MNEEVIKASTHVITSTTDSLNSGGVLGSSLVLLFVVFLILLMYVLYMNYHEKKIYSKKFLDVLVDLETELRYSREEHKRAIAFMDKYIESETKQKLDCYEKIYKELRDIKEIIEEKNNGCISCSGG